MEINLSMNYIHEFNTEDDLLKGLKDKDIRLQQNNDLSRMHCRCSLWLVHEH